MEEKLKVFISYKSEDRSIAEEVVQILEDQDFLVWYDQKGIRLGDNYLFDIPEAIDQVDVVLLLHSKEAEKSDYIYREIERALDKKKLIIPIMLDDALPEQKLHFMIKSIQQLYLSSYSSIQLAMKTVIERLEEYQLALEGKALDIWSKKSDFNKITPSSILQLGSIMANQLDKAVSQAVSEHYVPAAGYETLAAALKQKRIIVLTNAKNVGKFTTGIALLNDMETNQIIQLLPGQDLTELAKAPLKSQTGYIMEQNELAALETLGPVMENRLRDTNSYLIFISSQEKPTAVPYRFKVDSPDLMEIWKHRIVRTWGEEAYKSLPEIAIQEIGQTPEEVVQSVKQLEPAMTGAASLDEVFESFASRSKERIIDWFKKHGTSREHVAHFLALAAYRNTTDRVFISAVTGLQEALPTMGAAFDILTDDERMDLLHAERIVMQTNTDIGYVEEAGIQLLYQADSQQINETFWNIYRTYRSAYLSWIETQYLTGAVKERDKLIQLTACLLQMDFLFVRENLLQKWAKHEETVLQIAAVQVLLEVINQQVYVKESLNLINSWAGQGNLRLNWTAAMAMSTPIGMLQYQQSLSRLKRMYLAYPRKLHQVVRRSYAQLFETEDAESREQFIIFFREWLEDETASGFRITAFLSLFFAILKTKRKFLFETFSAAAFSSFIQAFVVEAWQHLDTKLIAEEFLTNLVYQTPDKAAILISALLQHDAEAVKVRTTDWFKLGLEKKDTAFVEVFKSMREMKQGE